MAEEEVQQQMEGDEESVPVMVDRSKLTPNMRHYLQMSKLHSQNEYAKGSAETQSKNEFTKTFCEQAEYQINKKVHDETVDRNYTAGKQAAVESHKGHQNLGYDNPQLAHHAKNAEMLSDAFYKEKYEADKDIVYFPVDTAPTYQSAKRAKAATDDRNYKADYEEMKKTNQLNLCETPVYKTQQEHKAKVSNAAYTKNYEETKTNVHPAPVTHDMILSQKQQAILTKDAYTKEGLGAIRSYNNDASLLNRGDIQQAMKTQKVDDHLKLEYKKDYEENKTKYEFEKALNDVPLIQTNIKASKQADPTNTTYGQSGKKAMERNEFTKTFCDTNLYKTNKMITNITRDSVYQAGKQEAIDKFKGFQQMDIMQVGSFVQHAANAENQSDNYYKEDWENDKDLVYFPANMTPVYEEQKKINAIKSNYPKEAAKDAETHHFNLAESETYKLAKDVKNATCDREYTKKWQEQKVQVKPAAITPQMELIEKNKVTKDAAYTEQWNKDKLSIHYPPDNPAMLNAKKAAKQSSDLEYKKDYNQNVLGAKSHMTADGDLEYVVAKNVQNITGANYSKDAKKAMDNHGYAPEFVQTEAYKINKNITEITSDRYNHAARKDMITYKGYQTMDPAHNPSIQHHAKNADQLNPYIYKEDYEWEKHNFYFPQHATEQYVNQKKLQEKVGAKEYVEDYNKEKKSNKLDLTQTPVYQSAQAAEQFRSDKKYKEKYDAEVKGHCIGFTSTPHMDTIKQVKPFQNDSSYQAAAREAMKKNVLGEDNPELELAKKRQEIRSDVHYKKDYRENVQGHNIPCPVDCFQDYKTQAEVKAKTNDAAYKKDYEETKTQNSITKEYCNTEQYKAQQKVKQCQSHANYTDFPKTRDEMKGFQQLEITTIPSFMMHARNADQLSEAVYKEDWNIDKECVYFPVQVTEKYSEDKKLNKAMKEYKKDYDQTKTQVNYNQAETEKYLQDKKMADETSDNKGYKKDYRENVQGTMKGTAVTMEMEKNEKLKITKDAAYTADAKERMKKYDRSLQDPDMETMAKAQVQRSDRDYKKDYNENVLGHNIGAPIEGHLDYYAQKQVKEKVADAAYKKDANEQMRTYTLEPNAPVLRNNIEIQKTVNHALYTQSGKDAIKEFKGFQQLDVFKNPYMNRHIINSENLSDAMYRENYEIDKDCIYYPYNTSEKYCADKKLHETAGDLAYSAQHKEEDWKHKYDLCTSEKYLQDKAGEAFKGQGYIAKHSEDKEAGKLGGTLVHTWEIDAKNVLSKLRDRVYKSDASNLQRKYHLMMDDLKLEHLMKVQNVQNDRLYKKLYEEETKGKGAADPGIAYPWIKDQKTLIRAMRRKNYEADARKRMETVHYDVWEEQNRARVIALAAKDSEYRKSRDNAIATMKGFQTMPAADHPDVVRGNRAADLASHWLYINDWEEEKDLVFFPVQETEKYLEDKKLEKNRQEYSVDSKEVQSKVRFNLCDTEKYANDLKHENVRSDKKYQADYKENSHKNISVDVTMEMERIKPLKAYTPVNYAKEAKNLAMKYGLTPDDNKLAASILNGKITSDLLYKKHYRENVQGKAAANPGIAYEMSTEMAKRNTNQLSDTVYQKEGKKAMMTNEYTKQQYTEMVKARLIALTCNDAEYKKGKAQAVEEFKGYMRMDASVHPIVTRGIEVSEMLSDALYKEDWNMERDLIYYPVNVTPMYETMKNNKTFQSDLIYREKYHEEKYKNTFNQCDTAKYADDHKIKEVQSDATYRKEWNETQRHQYTTPAVTMEMERVSPLKKLTAGVYAREAKNLAMKYGLVYDDITLTNLIAVGSLASDKCYKKKYNEEDLGKSSKADFNGYLPYVSQKDVKDKTCDKNYTKDAKEANMHNKFVQWEEELRAKKMALSVKDSEYKKSMWDAIRDMKGFMRMDAASHPIVTRGIEVAEMQSQALYTEEWEIEKDAIYFPVQITPGYETAMNADKIQSDLHYKKDFQETKMKNKFDQTQTEKYGNDKALDQNVRSDKGYHKNHEENKFKYTSIPVTSEMERASIQRDLRDANYSKTAKNLAMKYGLTHDDIKLKTLIAVGDLASDRIYKKKYTEERLGLSSKADVNGYLPYVTAKEVHDKTCDRNYTKDAKEANMHNKFVQWEEELRAKKMALSVKDSEYKKSMWDAIRDMKGFMRMDAALHPVVTRGIEVAEMQSQALYTEEWDLEKDLIYFPVQVTPGYETAVSSQKFQSNLLYTAAHEETKMNNKYDQTQTERYQDIQKAEKSRSDKTYRAAYEETKHISKGIAVTMDMERIKPLKSINEVNYKAEAKALAMKYGLTADDCKLANSMQVAAATSDRLYKKHYNENVLGLSSKADVQGHPVYKDSAELKKKLGRNYTKDAMKILEKNNYAQFEEEVRARTVALYCNPDEYSKQRRECINDFKGYMRMDAASHPIVTRGIEVAEMQSMALYREDYEIEKDLIYFPAQVTPGYESAQNAYKFSSELKYREKYNEAKFSEKPNVYNQVQTEKYQADKAVDKIRSDHHYTAAYNKQKQDGKGAGSSIPVTMEMERLKSLEKIAVNEYKKEAKVLAMKYGLDAKDMTMENLINVQQLRSDLNYKKKYNAEMLGLKSVADLDGYPHLKESNRLQKAMTLSEYSKGARENLKKNNYAKFEEQDRAEKMAYSVRGSNYQRQMKETIDKYKGFQRMDAATHPIVLEGERVNSIISHQQYIEDYLLDRNLIYYPVHMTPGYEAAMFADKWQSNIPYTADYRENRHKNKYNMAETERYGEIKTHEKYRSDKAYKAKQMKEFSEGKGFSSIKETPEMVISKVLKPLRTQYQKDAKDLASKYGLVAGAMEIAHAIEMSEVTNMNLYKKKWEKEVQGTSAKNPAIAHPLYDLYKQNQINLNDANYKKDFDKMHTFTAVESDEVKRARKVALSCTPREYTKQRAEVIEKYKGFQRMDAASHPIVIEGERVNNLISKAKYLEDYLIDRESVYYPVHLTEGYDVAIKGQIFQSQKNYKNDYNAVKHKHIYNAIESEKYNADKNTHKFFSDWHYKKGVKDMFSEGKGFTEVADRFDVNLSKSLDKTRGEKYTKEAKEICGKYGLAHDAMAVTSAIAVGDLISQRLYKKKWEQEVQGKGATNPAIAHPEYLHYKDVQSALNQTNYKAEYEKTQHTYTCKESDEVLRARKVALQCTDREYTKQRAEVINAYKGFQRMDAHQHPIVMEGERVNDIISNLKYIEDYLIERNMVYFPAHITPVYETAVNVGKFQSDIPYRKDYRENRHKNVYNTVDTEKYKESKAFQGKYSDKAYSDKWHSEQKLKFTSIKETPVIQQAIQNTKNVQSNTYDAQAKEILSKYGLEFQNLGLQHCIEAAKHHKDYLYKAKYNTDTLGKGANYKGIDDVCDYARAKVNQANLNDEKYRETGEKYNHTFTPVYDTPTQLLAIQNQKNINHHLYSQTRREAIEKFKGFQRMDAATHPIVVEGERVNEIISQQKYIEDYLIDRNVIYYPVHLTPGYETAMYANKWQSNLKYQEAHHQNKWKHDFNATTTEKYNEDKQRIAKISNYQYGKDWMDKLHNSKQHTQIADPTEVKLSKAIKPWIGGTAYTKAAKDIAAKHGLVSGDMSLRHAAESQLQLSLKDYRKAWSDTVRGTGGKYQSIDDMFVEKQAKVNQVQLSDKLYKAKDEPNLHKYTPVSDTPDMRRVKAQAGLLNEVAYSQSRRDCIDKFKGFQNMDAHQHPIVVHGTEANDRISNAKYTEEWNEMKEMIYFPVQITPGYESAMQAYNHQSQILYNKEYHRTKHANNYDHTKTENYQDIQKHEKARSDFYYQQKYRETRGKGFSEVATLKEKTAQDVQKSLSMKDYVAAAKQIAGKYHIDCNAMQVVHAVTAAKVASDKVYLEDYNKNTKGAPSKYFHQTETYDVYKKNAYNMNPNTYAADNEKIVHTYHFDDKSVAMEHAKAVIKFCSQSDYSKTQREVYKTFKAYSKLTLQDDMAAVRSVENSKNISQWRYIEDYLEERQYAFFPVHITPGYENAIKHTEFQAKYHRDYEESKKKGSQFKPNETEFYQYTKNLNEVIGGQKYTEKYEADKAKGYKGGKMLQQETMSDAQSKLSLWKYHAEAKKVMGKFNIDMELPTFKLAKENQVNQSESLYRKDGKQTNTKYTSAGKDEFALKMHGDNKVNMHPKKYKEAYEKTQHTYHVDVNSVSNVLVRESAKIASDREYKKGYANAVKNSSAYKAIDMWPEDRFHMEVTKQQSDHVYKEDYLIDRECCFYPVHITPGYELALEVNKFQSAWLYTQKYNKDTRGRPNQFRQTETELYQQGKKLDEIRNDEKYREAGRQTNTKWQFTVITPVNEHHKTMKELNHPRAYNDEAKQIMMKYDLPVTRVDMEQHRECRQIVSDYVYHKKYRAELGKSHLWNADKALEGDRHRENTKNMSVKAYKKDAFDAASKIKMPADMFSMKAATEASANISNLDYKKSYEQAIKTCRAFTKLGCHDIKEYEHHNYVQKLLSDKHYKEEWYDQQGWCIPEFDTPDYRRLREQYDRGDVSDVIYKKKFNKNVKGKGLTVFDGPDFQHAKAMKTEQSKIAYEAAGKDKHKWSSHVANFTPMAIEQKAAQEFVSDRNYIDRSEYQGRGASCVTDELSQQLEAQKMESQNAYKKAYEETKHKSDFVKVTDAIDAVGFKEAQKLQSDNLYKKKHLEEDIGKPAELAMSIKLNTDRAHQQLASELPYKAKGEVSKHIQSYQNNLYLTPWAEYVSEMKHLMSDIKYKQEWEDEKSAIWVPYWWTVEYEHFKSQTDEKNMIKYQAKAKKANAEMNLSDPKAPSIVQAKESYELCSDLNYGDKKKGIQIFPSPKCVVDAPGMVSQKEAQKMASDLTYKKDNEAFIHNFTSDPSGFDFMEHQYLKEGEASRKSPKLVKPDKSYDGNTKALELKDDYNLKDRTEAQKLQSDNLYKREAAAEMHAVNGAQVTDTPWQLVADEAQKYASDLHYKQDISKIKIFDQGLEDVKEHQRKHAILSDLEYRKEYEEVWKGAVLSLPIPFDLNMESQCDRQKVRDERAYKKDALARHRNYVLVPDTPRMRQLKELYESSERNYKAAATAEMHAVNLNITDSYSANELKRINQLKDDRAYKAEAMAEMSLNAQIPTKDIQHALASTLVADKTQYSKAGKEMMKSNLQTADNLETQHAKEVKALTSDRLYKEEAIAEMNMVNCNVVSHEMETKQEAQKMTNETQYKIEAQAEMHQVNMNVPDSYALKNCAQIQENISEIHYKNSDQFGGITDNEWCFQLPNDMSIVNRKEVSKYQSDAEYKKKHQAEKGKTAFIPADTEEFKRLKKLQEQYSDLEYREAAKKGMKELTFTPSLEEATKATELASTVKYAKKAKEMSGKNLQVMDSTTEHAATVMNETLASQLKYKEQFNSEKGNKISMALEDDLHTKNLDSAQKNVSQARYIQKPDTAEFTKLEKTYDQDRHAEQLNYVSDARYKQKLEGKSLDMVPEIEAKLEFQTMASKLEYVKNADQHKNKFMAQETEMYKQLKDLKSVQSEVQYSRKAKQGMDKHKAEGLDNRVDIDHNTNVSKICSENEYKKNKQQSGFTFVPEAPLHEHHRHAGDINSELKYKRDGLNSQKGKGILFDETNPFQQTYSDAQKFTSGRNYKTAAKELNARGCGTVEDDPTMERVRRAGKILSDREYKKDFEKGVKGYGYDLRTTPQMKALKNAELIKSDVEYKKQYTESMKGKGGYTMESPQMKAAMAAQALMRGEKLGGIGDVPDAIAANDKWIAARVNAILDTPEMRRIKEAKKNSMVNYKDIDYSRGGKIVLDTPEMERIKKASKNQSKVHYSDNASRGRTCNVLDTPEMRMVRRNQKNYSKLDYAKDFESLKGKATQVVDDLNTRRAKKATEIASDLAYKGIKGKIDQSEMARNMLENQARQEKIRSAGPSQAKGFTVGKRMDRYKADPGSIFELDDPTDTEHGTHKMERPSSRLSAISSQQDQEDSDYELLANWDPNRLQQQTSGSWQNYLTGSYKKAYAPNHVMKYKEEDSHQALQQVGYESSFYGSAAPTPAVPQTYEEEPEQAYLTFKALYDYTAADDDEISFAEGDIIVQAQPVGGGWYFGVVERTGASGMLPGNYVEEM